MLKNTSGRILPGLIAFVGLLTLAGCTYFGVNRNWAREGIVLGAEDQSRSNQLSRESLEVLYRENLLEDYSRDPQHAFELLLQKILADPEKQRDPSRLFAAAEFANVLAERDAPPWNRRPFIKPRGQEAVGLTDQGKIFKFLEARKELLTYYGMAAYLSFSYLTLVSEQLEAEAFKPQFRRACEIYNYSLEQGIRFHLDAAPFNPQSFYRLETANQAVKTRFELVGFDWGKEDFHELIPAEDFAVREIGPNSTWKGLGVPLIGLRYRSEEDPAFYFPKVLAFPVTALHVPNTSFDLETTESRDVIYLVNPWNKNSVQIGQLEIPIEADLSTPLNYTLTRTGFNSNRWKGFTGKDATFNARVFLIQPHRPGRIPVVLCHGLLSSPGPWETLVNGLMDDPWVRERYEFWFLHYPTGKGLLLNATDVRSALESTRKALDPKNADAALDQMVFVGHSMGGLLATLVSHDSGDHLWNAVWSVPVEQLELTEEDREIVRKSFYFERYSPVTRVIYIASPHAGSPVASSAIGRLGTFVANVPKSLADQVASLEGANQQYAKTDLSPKNFTSVAQLREDSPLLQAMRSLDRPEGVHFHNIIGNIGEKDGVPSDGVVPVSSADVAWAETKIEVPAKHTQVQRHPLTISEIQKILKEHATHSGVAPPRPNPESDTLRTGVEISTDNKDIVVPPTDEAWEEPSPPSPSPREDHPPVENPEPSFAPTPVAPVAPSAPISSRMEEIEWEESSQ